MKLNNVLIFEDIKIANSTIKPLASLNFYGGLSLFYWALINDGIIYKGGLLLWLTEEGTTILGSILS